MNLPAEKRPQRDAPADRRDAAIDVDRLARALAVLADPLRLRIVGLVAQRELAGVEVAEALGISQALACHHLKQLVDCGLVTQRRKKQAKYNLLNRDLLASYLGQALDLGGPSPNEAAQA